MVSAAARCSPSFGLDAGLLARRLVAGLRELGGLRLKLLAVAGQAREFAVDPLGVGRQPLGPRLLAGEFTPAFTEGALGLAPQPGEFTELGIHAADGLGLALGLGPKRAEAGFERREFGSAFEQAAGRFVRVVGLPQRPRDDHAVGAQYGPVARHEPHAGNIHVRQRTREQQHGRFDRVHKQRLAEQPIDEPPGRVRVEFIKKAIDHRLHHRSQGRHAIGKQREQRLQTAVIRRVAKHARQRGDPHAPRKPRELIGRGHGVEVAHNKRPQLGPERGFHRGRVLGGGRDQIGQRSDHAREPIAVIATAEHFTDRLTEADAVAGHLVERRPAGFGGRELAFDRGELFGPAKRSSSCCGA